MASSAVKPEMRSSTSIWVFLTVVTSSRDSSSSLSSENDVAVHPELSYNLSVAANGVNQSTTSYDVNPSTTSYGVNPSTTSYDVNSSTTSYGVNPSTPTFSTSNLGTTPYNYTNQPTTEPNGTSL